MAPLAFMGRVDHWAGRKIWPYLYHARLRPERFSTLLMDLTDPWPGDATAGRSLLSGHLDGDGETIPLKPNGWSGLFRDHGRCWGEKAHGFSFLRDLRDIGGEQARLTGRQLILGWIAQNRIWGKQGWDPALTGQRVCHWLVFYPFFMESADAQAQSRFFDNLARQVRHLELSAHKVKRPAAALLCGKGLLYSGLMLANGQARVAQGLALFLQSLTQLVNSEGMVVSRNPMELLVLLCHAIDVRTALRKAGRSIPDELENVIPPMAKALRFFRMSDKKLCVMHGAQQGRKELLDQAARLACVPIRRIGHTLPESGYLRRDAGKTSLIFDVGPVGGAQTSGHLGALSFEFSDRNDRLLVNCGHHLLLPAWNKYMRMSAAHTTLTVNDQSAQACVPYDIQTRQLSEGVMMQATHDGYAPFKHTRKLFLQTEGEDLRGEDIIQRMDGGELSDRDDQVCARFHLHPDCDVFEQSGSIMIKTKSGTAWRFTASPFMARIEESLYLGQGAQKRQSRMIVLEGPVEDELSFSWAFCRL